MVAVAWTLLLCMPAASETSTVPTNLPAAVGWNVAVTVQEAPAVTFTGQLVATVPGKGAAPEKKAELNICEAFVRLVSVKVAAAVFPSGIEGSVTFAGVRLKLGSVPVASMATLLLKPSVS